MSREFQNGLGTGGRRLKDRTGGSRKASMWNIERLGSCQLLNGCKCQPLFPNFAPQAMQETNYKSNSKIQWNLDRFRLPTQSCHCWLPLNTQYRFLIKDLPIPIPIHNLHTNARNYNYFSLLHHYKAAELSVETPEDDWTTQIKGKDENQKKGMEARHRPRLGFHNSALN